MPRPATKLSTLLWQGLLVCACLALTGYFAHHAFYGRHGIEARERLTEQTQVLDVEIESLTAVRDRIARDVALLHHEPAHEDLVEEIARDVLGFAHPRDRIYLIK